VARGRTLEGGATPAYWPWIDVLRAVVEAHPEAVRGLEPLLGCAPGAERDPAPGNAFDLFEAVAGALAAASQHRSVVVLLDDLQWADRDSLELLSFLVGRLREEPVLLVLTVRQLELGQSDAVVHVLAAAARRPHSRRLSLRGLDEAATGELVAAALGDPAPVGLVDVIHARSGGNPFFAGELARLLAEQADAPQGGAEVPAGVRDVVRQRLARLPQATRELLPLAAVLGRDVEPSVLATAAEQSLDDCLDQLEPALVTHLLVSGDRRHGSLRFSHALVREVLVDDLSSLRRARLHLRAAEALLAQAVGAEDRAEVVAEHLWEAVPLGVGLRAAAALERAGDVALWRTASESAERLFERALELRRTAGDDEGELAGLLRLGAAQRAGKGFGAAAGTFGRARELAARTGRTAVLVELLWAEWGEADTACDFVRGRRLADQLGDVGRSSDNPALRATGLAAEGIQRLHEGGIGDARRMLDEAHALLAATPRPTSPGFAADHRLHTEAFRLLVHDLTGIDAAEAFEALAADQTDLYSATVVRSFSVTAATAVGDADRLARLTRRGAPTFYDVFNRMAAGAVAMATGQVEAGRAVLDDAVRRYRGEAGRHSGLGLFLANAGLALLTAGRPDEAEAYVRDARHELDTYGERYPEPIVLLAEAALGLACGAPLEAVLRDLAAAAAVATGQGAHRVARRIDAAAAALGT
jgi:tetratricopeptide (TPR) repeat protein